MKIKKEREHKRKNRNKNETNLYVEFFPADVAREPHVSRVLSFMLSKMVSFPIFLTIHKILILISNSATIVFSVNS
jgi:hypothetical protein